MRPITAADVMNPEVLTVPGDWTVKELADFLVRHEISGAPVEDSAGRLVGVVSVTDVAQVVADSVEPGAASGREFFVREWDEGPGPEKTRHLNLDSAGLLVRDIMNPDLYSVPAETPVPEVAEILVESHIHRLLVTRDERVVGILSTSDLLGLLIEKD